MLLKNVMCQIRLAMPTDVSLLTKWWSDGRVMAHAGYPEGLTIDQKALGERLENQWIAGHKGHKLFIIETSDRIPIGETGYRMVDELTAEIGIKICESSYQELGLGTESLKILIRHLFDEQNVQRIILDTTVENKRAQHVYEKIGFKCLGINKKRWKDQLGNDRQSIDYELDIEQYNNNKSLYV